MKLIALVTELQSAARYLAKIGERVDIPGRSKSRGPPYAERETGNAEDRRTQSFA